MSYFSELAFSLLLGLSFSMVYEYPQISFAEPQTIYDKILKIEKSFAGPVKPTSMAFTGSNEFLILERNEGKVYRVTNGEMDSKPLLDVNVATDGYRGMLGIAVSAGLNKHKYFFVFY